MAEASIVVGHADGSLDVLFANSWDDDWIFLNRGGRDGFDLVEFGSASDGSYGLAVGDLDGDGVPDVVETNDGTHNRVYYGWTRSR